jgi:hypothetical protein
LEEDVFVIGVVRKGITGTIVVGEQPMVSYYIEAWFVVPKIITGLNYSSDARLERERHASATKWLSMALSTYSRLKP